jgi:hypothetical protein
MNTDRNNYVLGLDNVSQKVYTKRYSCNKNKTR